ncbi:MAG TPA: BTAD domain-containing putative transcriptional regulator [Actinospica sp.]|nr:BTAD domain-containing putative transcriptional regulator [Actinospica sp.]
MPSLTFSLLGRLRVTSAADGTEVEIRGRIRKTLVAALLLEAGTVVPLDRLVGLAWGPESDPADSRIYNQIKRLRTALGDAGSRIRFAPPGYVVDLEPGELDLHVFAEHCAAARAAADAGRWAEASRRYAAALGLWRGSPLEDVPALAALPAVARLEEERWAAVLGRGEAELNLGRFAELVPELRDLVKQEPEHEALHRHLMLALYRGGRRGAALDVYLDLARTLDERSGLEPGAQIRALYEEIRGAGSARNQLPADTRLFTGREPEVARLLSLAKRAGAVTISAVDGLAGVGKTALAVHVAHRLGDRFPDGQLFVDLRGYTKGLEPLEPQAALGYLLRSVDVAEAQIPADQADRAALLRERLTDTRTLILLDNAGSAEQVRPLVPDVPGCMTLITSRTRLADLAGAQAFSVDALPPDAARTLLRVAAGNARIRPDEPALDDLVELCGGIPLALRIVAARLRHGPSISVASLVAELRSEGGRLRNLRDDDRGLTEIFESSYAALPTARQRALRLLGVVPGAEFDAHAAAAVFDCGLAEAAAHLGALADHSLLIEPRPGRYRFHDLMRLYAREVAERDDGPSARRAAFDRLLHWYTASTRSAAIIAYPGWRDVRIPPSDSVAEPLEFADPQQAVDWYDVERDQLFAAVEAAEREGSLTYGWLLPAMMIVFMMLRGRPDDRLALAESGLRCAERLQDVDALDRSLRNRSTALMAARRDAEAIEAGERSLEFTRKHGLSRQEATQLGNLSLAYANVDDMDRSIEYGRESLRISTSLGDEPATIPARLNLAASLSTVGRPAEAIEVVSEGIEVCRRTGITVHLGAFLGSLGDYLTELDPPDYVQAERCLLEALQELVASGHRHHEATSHGKLGLLCEKTGRPAEALAHLREADRICVELDTEIWPPYREALDRLKAPADLAP